ncbi:MAG TPA: MotA/TolQ/ExbB proton channel family protein [Cellvibrionaceae bacterium]
MSILSENLPLLTNLSVIAIFATTIVCYALLIDLCFIAEQNQDWYDRSFYWMTGLKQMLTALPLLGLFGTVTGLLRTFRVLADGGDIDMQEIITGGIAEALFTTQLGLVMVVPGLVVLALLHRKRCMWLVRQINEI